MFYCLYSFLNDFIITSPNIFQFGKKNTFLLLSIFTVIEYIVFSIVLYLHLKKLTFRRIILLLFPFFIGFSIFQFFNAPTTNIDAFTITVEYILIISLCLLYFFEKISEPNATFMSSSYIFWILVGILIYSAGTFFFFMQSAKLSNAEWDKWININYVCTIIENLFFSLAIVMRKEEEKNLYFDQNIDGLFEEPYNHLTPNP